MIDIKLLVSARLFPDALLQLTSSIVGIDFFTSIFLFYNKILITSYVYLNAIYFMLLQFVGISSD